MFDKSMIVQALQALAHEARLEVFLALMEAGPGGQPAGALAKRLGMAPNALSFHLTRLRYAGLVRSTREGQRILYSACYEQMEGLVGFLAERCCRASAEPCGPVCGGQRPDARQTTSRSARTPSATTASETSS